MSDCDTAFSPHSLRIYYQSSRGRASPAFSLLNKQKTTNEESPPTTLKTLKPKNTSSLDTEKDHTSTTSILCQMLSVCEV